MTESDFHNLPPCESGLMSDELEAGGFGERRQITSTPIGIMIPGMIISLRSTRPLVNGRRIKPLAIKSQLKPGLAMLSSTVQPGQPTRPSSPTTTRNNGQNSRNTSQGTVYLAGNAWRTFNFAALFANPPRLPAKGPPTSTSRAPAGLGASTSRRGRQLAPILQSDYQ